jgi:hypothetical protein
MDLPERGCSSSWLAQGNCCGQLRGLGKLKDFLDYGDQIIGKLSVKIGYIDRVVSHLSRHLSHIDRSAYLILSLVNLNHPVAVVHYLSPK